MFQFIEGLSDRQAAETIRSRIDWKYALGLELADPGFDFSVLSKFWSRLPKGQAERQQYAELIGSDASHLLSVFYGPPTPALLKELPAVEHLRQIWVFQYYADDGHLRRRKAEDLPPAEVCYDSPYDPQAHYGNKRSITWTGYKVHVTETCDDDELHVITQRETTPAGLTDSGLSAPMHDALAKKALLPQKHFMDLGYVDTDFLVKS